MTLLVLNPDDTPANWMFIEVDKEEIMELGMNVIRKILKEKYRL